MYSFASVGYTFNVYQTVIEKLCTSTLLQSRIPAFFLFFKKLYCYTEKVITHIT